jgi:hypothetical protein
MMEVCMFDILALPEEDLKKVLSKASTRSLAKLVVAYPRAAGKTFLDVLAKCLSGAAIEFIREEVYVMKVPSYPEIRNAEMELMKIMHEERLDQPASSVQLAKSLQR